MAALVGVVFDRKDQLIDRLRHGPGKAAQKEMALSTSTSITPAVPGRWSLRTIRATFDFLTGYTLSGVWRMLNRFGLQLRSARVQLYSPDPDYKDKEAYLHTCLKQAAKHPKKIICLFLDEMGYYRWPEPGLTWAEGGTLASTCCQQSRIEQSTMAHHWDAQCPFGASRLSGQLYCGTATGHTNV